MRQCTFVLLAAAFSLSACTGKDDDKKNNNPPDPVQVAVQQLGSSYCNYLETCGDSSFNPFASVADCQTAMTQLYDMEGLAADNIPAINACVAALNADQGCSYQLFFGSMPEACEDIGRGTATAGQACPTGDECAAGYYCGGRGDETSDFSPICSTCAARQPLNEACDWDYQCAYGLECGSQDTCVAIQAPDLLPIDAACASHFQCASMVCEAGQCGRLPIESEACLTDHLIACALPLACVSGTCTRLNLPAGQGQPCPANYDDHLACTGDLICRDDGSGQYLCLGLYGEEQGPCSWDDDCQAGLYCDWEDTETCLAYAALDQSCATASCDPAEAYCAWPANICTAFLAVGGDCSGGGYCDQGLWCDWNGSGQCELLLGPGQSCGADYECEDWICAAGQCRAEGYCVMP